MANIVRRRKSRVDHVLASGLQWQKNTLQEATKVDKLAEMMWTATVGDNIECRIIRRSEGHYFWSVLQTLDTGIITLGTGTTNALAFWYAADDVAAVLKSTNNEDVA